MSEKIILSKNFEQNTYHEIEQKFIPLFPEKMSEFRENVRPIEQFYLSHPDEPFSLRLREILDENGELAYSATLKDRGKLTASGLDRLEVEVPINPELYHYYKPHMPIVRKLRAEPLPNVAIDFYDDGHVQIESENPESWRYFTAEHGNDFVDVTGDHIVDNEWRAYMNHWRENHDSFARIAPPELSASTIADTVLAYVNETHPTFVSICGRSGSGKSTIVRKVQEIITECGQKSVVISTDDYHRGASWLRARNNGAEWTKWDDPIVYDTGLMAENLRKLYDGQSIPNRTIDFSDCEPHFDGEIAPAAIVIIEGIYAGSRDFDGLDVRNFTMTTPLATCIGRRLLRDMHERPQFADPEKSLIYMLEEAEPAWRDQSL